MTAKEIKYIQKALQSFKVETEGQFGQSSSRQPEETKDGAAVIEFLLEECSQRRRDLNSLMVYLQTAKFKAPEYSEKDLARQNNMGF